MKNLQQTRYRLSWIQQVAEVPREQWDALAQPLISPFFEWDWLQGLEASGSATGRSGWQPCHLVVWREDPPQSGVAPQRRLVAAAPLYLKAHSYGEFVFDHQWADLAHRLGVEYYPKLLGMSPFTPAVGYRFLMDPDEDEAALTEAMVAEIDQFCDRNNISGCHFLYVDPDWRSPLESLGFMPWLHHNSVWHNQGFQTFEDYLTMFNANQRRNIKRERKAMAKAGLRLVTVTGEQISHRLLEQMYSFYSHHCDRFGWWGSKYLTKAFFVDLHHALRHRLLLVAAVATDTPTDGQEAGTIAAGTDLDATDLKPVGMSFCVYKGDRLYGRYWGSFQEFDCLHFNACYYTPIEWAIDHGVQIFDPGAGGSHKKRRGFPATPHHSLHRFYHDRLGQILQSHLHQVNPLVAQEMEAINQELPFTKPEIELPRF
ncbi:MAG: GNAT family N-acetyltransferase [Prochlorothrix sp.]|nr:GNAT family N-acetyltransferase [Prochlorothrix sp.]